MVVVQYTSIAESNNGFATPASYLLAAQKIGHAATDLAFGQMRIQGSVPRKKGDF